MALEGIYLPIITPFVNGKIDWKSYDHLINHYMDLGIAGIIPMGTTGEAPTLEEHEVNELLNRTVESVNGRVPVFIGYGGNNTAKVVSGLKTLEKSGVQGILSVSPYYNRPSQEGIYEHFKAISQESSLEVIVYNIPYRTGRTVENETIHKLAELPNIVGLKDASGDMKQTTELLLNPPKDFSILSGEDNYFFHSMALGGAGGILASAHIETAAFVQVYQLCKNNQYQEALKQWKQLSKWVPLLFEEPNPSPIKYVLEKQGLIESSEVRLPLTKVSENLQEKLNNKFHI